MGSYTDFEGIYWFRELRLPTHRYRSGFPKSVVSNKAVEVASRNNNDSIKKIAKLPIFNPYFELCTLCFVLCSVNFKAQRTKHKEQKPNDRLPQNFLKS